MPEVKKSVMKRHFIYSCCIGIAFCAGLFLPSCHHVTDAERYKGEVDLADFDTTIKPQQDFYHYVNGTWLRKNPVPPSEAEWSSFHIARDSVRQRLRKILESAATDKTAKPGSIAQKVGDLFATMMDTVTRNKQGIEPLQDELNRIDAISDNKSLWAESARLMKLGINVMFGFDVEQDSKISSKEICVIGQGGTSFPQKEYYLSTDTGMLQIHQAFAKYSIQILRQLHESEEDAEKNVKKIWYIETEMAKASMSSTDMRDLNIQYNKMAMGDLEKQTPHIDWGAIRLSFGVNSIDSIISHQPLFMKKLSTLSDSVSLADWKTYLKFHLVNEEAGKLNDTLVKINFNFWGRTLFGVPEMEPCWKRSVEATSEELGQLLGQLYIKQYFSPAAKERVNNMVKNIIAAYKQRIEQLTWMDPKTKKAAIEKLDKTMLKLCYPDKWKDYSSLTIKRDSWLMNSFRINEFEFDYALNKLGKQVDRTEWEMAPQTINAYFGASLNEIVFPAAIMQPPFFDLNRDDAMNYGAMGAVIGHELTHGFDDEGCQFDANGNMNKWWTYNDSISYHKKLQVLIRQFDQYKIDDTIHVNGSLTIGENTADLGGLTIAYQALENELKEHPEGIVDECTPEQRFFIAWAQAWRANIRPAYQKQLILQDVHSPSIFRTNGPLSDMTEFYKAFSPKANENIADFKGFEIKPGDGMYRSDSTRAVIW